MIIDLQDRESTNLPLYALQLQEADTGIQTLLNAIQQGILTKYTKVRLEELEAVKEDLEIRIYNEKLTKQKQAPSRDLLAATFPQTGCEPAVSLKSTIDTFINAIYLFDDKMVITSDYTDSTRTITFDDVKTALKKETMGSDLDCSGTPKTCNCNSSDYFHAQKSLLLKYPCNGDTLCAAVQCKLPPSCDFILPMAALLLKSSGS